MKQHIIGYFRKHYKENISLLLILAKASIASPARICQKN